MTARERWQAVLSRKTPDRVPMDYWATAEATERLLRHLGCNDIEQMYRRLHIDKPVVVGARGGGPPADGGIDIFGCRYAPVAYGGGRYLECVGHPLAKFNSLSELQREYRWPTPDDFTYDHIPSQVRGREDRPIQGGGSEPFLRYTELRGQAQAYKDLLVNRELAEYCLDRLFELAYGITERIYAQIPGQVTVSFVAEDLGSQEDLLISPRLIREILLPRMRRMVELVKSAGAFAFTHSDGAIRRIIPDLIAIGIEGLNPIQWRCVGMDRAALKRDFGAALVFHGGVDNQQALAFGAVEDVRAEVAENLRVLGAGGGYIVAPCHNIQPISPPENVVAMYETGYALGRHGA